MGKNKQRIDKKCGLQKYTYPMPSIELNSSVIFGMAVAMIDRSSPTRKSDRYVATIMVQNFTDFGW
jgi:hypothetical protein